MRSCKEVSRLVSESMERKLSVWERVSLTFHLGMCQLCSGFSKNLQQIRDAMHQYASQVDKDAASPEIKLSPKARERIRHSLDRHEP